MNRKENMRENRTEDRKSQAGAMRTAEGMSSCPDFSDIEEVRRGILAAEILNRKY